MNMATIGNIFDGFFDTVDEIATRNTRPLTK